LDPSTDDHEKRTKIVLMPGQETAADDRFLLNQVPRNLDQTIKDTFRVYADGHVRYYDIFDQEHFTQFCTSYSYKALMEIKNDLGATLHGNLCPGFQNAN